MTHAIAYSHSFPLPWDVGREDRKKLQAWLMWVLLGVFIVGVPMPWLPLPEIEREELERLPPQLARILLEKVEPVIPPPPPPPEVKEEAKPKAEEKPVEEITVKPEPTVADAKEKAALSGLLAFKDAFADMRDAVDMSKLQDTGAIQRGSGEAASIDRAILTSKHGTRSAGVNVSALSRETGGVALSGRQTTKVNVPVGSKGTGGVRVPRTVDQRGRSIEEIRRVFDANKGAIFAIYNRALRRDPMLQGRVVLELVIDPNGQVIECKVVATELVDDVLVSKIVNRVRLFDFGERDVSTTTINYPVHFLPT
ncbi:MAG: AgmX/PglI C-terminal domain-containing protein [Gammaproteobacteria bacterium]|nr:AgmX/PglI C-terminal domain-containing protein [Gammaproteobacteria bacterium]